MATKRFQEDDTVLTLTAYEAFIVRAALRRYAERPTVSVKMEATALAIVETMEQD